MKKNVPFPKIIEQPIVCWRAKVKLYFAWIKAAQQASNFRPIVVINMDETSIRLAYNKRRGTVGLPTRWDAINPATLAENMSTGSTHGAVTYCAFICDNEEVQRCLPQVIIARTKFFTQAMERLAGFILPANVDIWLEQTSSWVTAFVFERLLRRLNESLREFRDRFNFILVVDALRSHINAAAAALVYELGLILILIPGRLTWLLQPLDTHYFAGLKASLVAKFCAARLQQPNGELPKLVWLQLLVTTIHEFRAGNFVHGIERSGLRGDQNISTPVTQGLITVAELEAADDALPTAAELARYLGRVNVPFYELLMQPLEEAMSESESSASELETPRPRIRIRFNS